MDILRRTRARAVSSDKAPIAGRNAPASALRRVVAQAWQRRRPDFGGPSGRNRRLGAALEQLRDGVPLNWGQVEDDDEMATLARLSQARQECRLDAPARPSAEFRGALAGKLAPRLRKPRTVKQEAQQPPPSLAGFSERVQVLTQVEDDVETGNNWLVFLGKAAAIVVVVGIAIWGATSLLGLISNPGFGWIELHRGKEVTSWAARARTWTPKPCMSQRAELPVRPRDYQTLSTVREVSELVGYRLPLVPLTMTQPVKLTFEPTLAAIDLCDGPRSVSPPDRDESAIAKLQYEVEKRSMVPGGKVSSPGQAMVEKVVTTTLGVYVAYRQPLPLDISAGEWHEVRIGDLHGVYWRGDTYRDMSGAEWLGDTRVLMVENEDTLATLISPGDEGLTEPELLEIARRMSWDSP